MDASTKFVVWDWNGTILDDTHLSHTALNAVLKNSSHEQLSIDRFRDIFDLPLRKLFVKAGFSEKVIHASMPDKMQQFHDAYHKAEKEILLREGVKDALVSLQNLKVTNVILSNHLTAAIKDYLKHLDLNGEFSAIIANDNVDDQVSGISKGEKLKKFIQDRRLTAENGVIIGDSLEEILIAKELGLRSIALTGGYVSQARLESVRPDHLIHSLHQLPAVLAAQRPVA